MEWRRRFHSEERDLRVTATGTARHAEAPPAPVAGCVLQLGKRRACAGANEGAREPAGRAAGKGHPAARCAACAPLCSDVRGR